MKKLNKQTKKQMESAGTKRAWIWPPVDPESQHTLVLLHQHIKSMDFPDGSAGKESACNTWVTDYHPLEKEMTTHSSIPA